MKQKIHLSSDISVGGRDCCRKNLAELLKNLNAWGKAKEQCLCMQGCFLTEARALLLSPPVQLQDTLFMTYDVEEYLCPWELWK